MSVNGSGYIQSVANELQEKEIMVIMHSSGMYFERTYRRVIVVSDAESKN
jgi:hypothetical protein